MSFSDEWKPHRDVLYRNDTGGATLVEKLTLTPAQGECRHLAMNGNRPGRIPETLKGMMPVTVKGYQSHTVNTGCSIGNPQEVVEREFWSVLELCPAIKGRGGTTLILEKHLHMLPVKDVQCLQ